MDLENVIRRIRLGERDALRELVTTYGPGVYEEAYAKTQDRTLAREITRQTFKQLVAILRGNSSADGWELLLGSMARRNIDTYSQIPSEMQHIGQQLERELFAEGDDGTASPAPTDNEIYAATAVAALRSGDSPAAPQPVYGQPGAPQHTFRPAESPTAAEAFIPDPSEANARPAAYDAPALHKPSKNRHAAHERADVYHLFDDAAPRHTFGGVCAVLLLVILCLVLLWIVLGVVLSLLGYADTVLFSQLGYVWFQQAFPQLALF